MYKYRYLCKLNDSVCKLQYCLHIKEKQDGDVNFKYYIPREMLNETPKETFCTFGGECSFKIKYIENKPTKIYKCEQCSGIGVSCELRISGESHLYPKCPYPQVAGENSFFWKQK